MLIINVLLACISESGISNKFVLDFDENWHTDIYSILLHAVAFPAPGKGKILHQN